MKYMKILGLLAVVAAAMMAFAASASATTVTGPSGETTPNIHAVNEGENVELHNAIANIKCQSTVEGDVQTHGTGLTVEGDIDVLTFFSCGDWVIHVVNKGRLSVHFKESNGGHNIATLTSDGATVTATHGPTGLQCGYQTANTDIGTITGGTTATLAIKAAIPRHAGSFLCGGSSANWTGNYVTTSTLKIDP